MDKITDEKRKELLNGYPVALVILSILGIINLLAISEDSLRAAAIVDLVLLIIIPIIFVLGYVDFKNFAPMSLRREIFYDGAGVVAMWIALIHFNVQNYTFLSDYTDESTYIIWVSIFAALSIAVGFICLLLTFINRHNRKKQSLYFYIVCGFYLFSNIMLTAFNYDTSVSLFWAPLLLINIEYPIIADTGLTLMSLRIFGELVLFIYMGAVERKRKQYKDNSKYTKPMMQLSIASLVFFIDLTVILKFISALASVNTDYYTTYYYVYMGFEIAGCVGLFITGIISCVQLKKSRKYGQIYLRMGVLMIIYALTYVIMDFIPVGSASSPDNVLKALLVDDIFKSSIKMVSLVTYILYISLNKKLRATEKLLDEEYLEKTSTENYSI